LQIVNILQRHYLRMPSSKGAVVRSGRMEAGALLGVKGFPATKALQMSQRTGN